MNLPITDGLHAVLVQERLRDADQRRTVLQARTILRRRARARRRGRLQAILALMGARDVARRGRPVQAPACC
jgi:hypothetical protein